MGQANRAGDEMREDLKSGLLAIAPHFFVHNEDADSFLLFSEDRSVRLKGEFYSHLLPLLNGTLTGAEIAERMPAPDLDQTLETLLDRGQISILAPGAAHHRQAFWSAAGLAPRDVEARLAAFRVSVHGLGQSEPAGATGAAAMVAGLFGAGLAVGDDASADLAIVLLDDYLDPAVARFAEGRDRSRPWLPVKPGGRRAMIGPVIGGGDADEDGGGCYFCLARRLAEHRPNDALLKGARSAPRPARAWFGASVELARATAILEVTGRALGDAVAVDGNVLALDMPSGDRRSHRHWRFADCPHCGAAQATADAVAAAPVVMGDSELIDSEIGGWRSWTTEDALERLEPLVSDITGIITGVEPGADFDAGLYVYTARHDNQATTSQINNRLAANAGSAGGKGLTPSQAKVSCLAEAAERYSCCWSGSEPRRRARLADLGDAGWHPHRLLNFSDRQYDERETINKTASATHLVPTRFDETAEIEWTPVWSLTDEAQKWVPTRFLYIGYRAAGVSGDHGFCAANSNGCASGATLAEAVLQGAFELVERDAVAIWWYNRLPRPVVRLEGIRDEFVDRMLRRYDEMGREIYLLDLTVDLAIPVVVAISVGKAQKDRPVMGFGSHFDPRIAAERALTELNQLMLFERPEIQLPKDDDGLGDMMAWIGKVTLESEPFLAGNGAAPIHVDEMACVEAGSLGEAVAAARDRFATQGMEMMVHDYARREIPLATVKVIVPGMRHFWSRRGPGRLNDVPARLGWLAEPHREDELNPTDFPF